MNVHYIQHVPFEGAGKYRELVQRNAHILTRTRPYLAENFPSVEDVDLLIVMGGPMKKIPLNSREAVH
ncbi:MAG TPA: hypothetical protein DDY32_06775 [Desulfobulbaceae bacterium]|nr:hypothetical protein [Desulfobulbaceae bacterium]